MMSSEYLTIHVFVANKIIYVRETSLAVNVYSRKDSPVEECASFKNKGSLLLGTALHCSRSLCSAIFEQESTCRNGLICRLRTEYCFTFPRDLSKQESRINGLMCRTRYTVRLKTWRPLFCRWSGISLDSCAVELKYCP